MVRYKISYNYYKARGTTPKGAKIAKFSKKVSIKKGVISGQGLEGKMNESQLIFRADDLEFRFTKRLEGDGFSIYSGMAYIEGIYFSDATAAIGKI